MNKQKFIALNHNNVANDNNDNDSSQEMAEGQDMEMDSSDDDEDSTYSDKEQRVALLLSIFVGGTGAGRWYIVKTTIRNFYRLVYCAEKRDDGSE